MRRLRAELNVADEPVSALDVSIQSKVSNLLTERQRKRGRSHLFISDSLAAVESVSDAVAEMNLGRVAKMDDAQAVFGQPRHLYTQALLSAIAEVEPPAEPKPPSMPLLGELPSPDKLPSGCRFHTRCAQAMDRRRSEAPRPVQVGTELRAHWL